MFGLFKKKMNAEFDFGAFKKEMVDEGQKRGFKEYIPRLREYNSAYQTVFLNSDEKYYIIFNVYAKDGFVEKYSYGYGYFIQNYEKLKPIREIPLYGGLFSSVKNMWAVAYNDNLEAIIHEHKQMFYNLPELAQLLCSDNELVPFIDEVISPYNEPNKLTVYFKRLPVYGKNCYEIFHNVEEDFYLLRKENNSFTNKLTQYELLVILRGVANAG